MTGPTGDWGGQYELRLRVLAWSHYTIRSNVSKVILYYSLSHLSATWEEKRKKECCYIFKNTRIITGTTHTTAQVSWHAEPSMNYTKWMWLSKWRLWLHQQGQWYCSRYFFKPVIQIKINFSSDVLLIAEWFHDCHRWGARPELKVLHPISLSKICLWKCMIK